MALLKLFWTVLFTGRHRNEEKSKSQITRTKKIPNFKFEIWDFFGSCYLVLVIYFLVLYYIFNSCICSNNSYNTQLHQAILNRKFEEEK
jgi:hypothetical protein